MRFTYVQARDARDEGEPILVGADFVRQLLAEHDLALSELEGFAMAPHTDDARCVCTDGLAFMRDVQATCNSRFDAADVLDWFGY